MDFGKPGWVKNDKLPSKFTATKKLFQNNYTREKIILIKFFQFFQFIFQKICPIMMRGFSSLGLFYLK